MPELGLRSIPLADTRELRRDVLRPYMTVDELAAHEPSEAVAFGAFEDGELIAVGLVGPEGEPGDWRIRGMATRPDARGRGAGTKVLQALVHHAVTYPGLRWHHRFARDLAMWPALVRDFPELRAALLHKRFFLRERSAAFDLAVLAAVLLAMRKPTGALLLLPYARLLRPAWRADGPRGTAEVISYDINTAIGLVAGSWRARTVVL